MNREITNDIMGINSLLTDIRTLRTMKGEVDNWPCPWNGPANNETKTDLVRSYNVGNLTSLLPIINSCTLLIVLGVIVSNQFNKATLDHNDLRNRSTTAMIVTRERL